MFSLKSPETNMKVFLYVFVAFYIKPNYQTVTINYFI